MRRLWAEIAILDGEVVVFNEKAARGQKRIREELVFDEARGWRKRV